MSLPSRSPETPRALALQSELRSVTREELDVVRRVPVSFDPTVTDGPHATAQRFHVDDPRGRIEVEAAGGAGPEQPAAHREAHATRPTQARTGSTPRRGSSPGFAGITSG